MSSSTSAPVPLLEGSSFFRIRTTSYGGRSLFAICDIEPGTLIHSSKSPFAHVIYKDYRKEVCAQCFTYSASDQAPPTVGLSRTWNIKWSREGATTAWFCSDVCKDIWECDEMLKEQLGNNSNRWRIKSRSRPCFPVLIMSPRNGMTGGIGKGTIDAAWERAEALVASRADLALFYSTLHIEGMELEIARSLAAAIVRRYCDERSQASSSDLKAVDTLDSTRNNEPRSDESWAQLLRLQTSEACNIQTRPYMLTAYLRIYVFLSNALPKHLRRYISTVREVLSRDTGNAFGIWDGDRRDEMMGWGIWVSASYFNHSASESPAKLTYE
ncbi:hypothetical protein JVU11DRAFT_6137 [Chiua virens]|nr:hypothetical protein JVU11DRAFT_6137 [Chiua virens]